MDQTCRTQLGDKLVWHSKGPIETAFKYNQYVVNGKLFRTVAKDEEKITQNSGVCVPTVDGDTYYGKLTQIIEVECYDTTRYVLFKCDWANIRKDRGWSEDEYGITLVNLKNLIHTGDNILDDPYVLSLLVCDWPHSVWTKSLVCKDVVLQGISLFIRVLEDSDVRKDSSLSAVWTIVPSRPDAHLCTVPFVRTTCHTVRTSRQT
jgi:hypothetical protein